MDEFKPAIVTRIVHVPNVGPMFRRVHLGSAGEELRVEYMDMVYGEPIPEPAPEAGCPVGPADTSA